LRRHKQMLPLYCVIATCRRPVLLKRTLSSIVICPKPENFQGIIVVENGPRCGVEEMIRQDFSEQKIFYFFLEEADKSKALNFALREFPGSLFYFLDDDVRLSETALMAVAGAASKIGERFFLGGPLGVDYEKEPPAWRRSFLTFSAKGWSLDVNELTAHNDANFLGGNWVAMSDDLLKEGGFSLDMGPSKCAGGEEGAMQRKLIRSGITGYYVPQAKAWHYVPKERCSVKWALKREYRNGEEGALCFKKEGRWKSLVKETACFFCNILILPVMFCFGKKRVFGCFHGISRGFGFFCGLLRRP
jgi:GT2 family glycosyltransferase